MMSLNEETRRVLVDDRQARLRKDWSTTQLRRAEKAAAAPRRRLGWLRRHGWKAAHCAAG